MNLYVHEKEKFMTFRNISLKSAFFGIVLTQIMSVRSTFTERRKVYLTNTNMSLSRKC